MIAFPSRDGKDRRQTFSLSRSAILVNVPEYRREREPQNKSHYLILYSALILPNMLFGDSIQTDSRSLTGSRTFEFRSSAYDAELGCSVQALRGCSSRHDDRNGDLQGVTMMDQRGLKKQKAHLARRTHGRNSHDVDKKHSRSITTHR